MAVNFTDNSNQVNAEFQKAVKRGLEAIGQTAEGYAKDNCPVDTGRLRNSISHATLENDEYIGTNVEYAVSVEYNDDIKHKTGKAHFLRDAATQHSEHYKRIMEASLKASGTNE